MDSIIYCSSLLLGVADLKYEFSFMEFLKPRLKLTFGYVQC
jgi:hypothetical protein